MADSTPASNPEPFDDSLAEANAALIQSQQALLLAQQAKSNARNEAALAPAASDGTTLQLVLDADLSALFNDPSASANNLFKSLVCLLQIVRLLQQSNAQWTALTTYLLALPPPTTTTAAPTTTTTAPTTTIAPPATPGSDPLAGPVVQVQPITS